MALKSKLAGGLAVTALVLASASPANARGYPNRWHHRDDGVSAGAVFGAILGVGLIAAIASSAAKKKEAENRGHEERRYDPRADDRDYEQRDYDDRAADDHAYDSGRGDSVSQGQAVDACAIAARDEASRSGGFAEVHGITGVQPYGNGWNVTGTLDQRSSYSANDRRERSFRCIWENGRVSNVTFGQSV